MKTKPIARTLLFLVLVAGSGLPAAAQLAFELPLHPAGVELTTKELAPGVYALLSTKPPVDNSGFVVGERGVLVIDAHINGDMARKIQAAVREVTPKPILYLVNTNYHGDHTFGNYAFPAETLIVAHRRTAERMAHFEREKEFLLATVDNDATVYADAQLRLPDIVFDDYLRLDLGDRVVELHYFGPGNTPGDTVVYVPEAKVAWTGNLVVGAGTIPFLLEYGVSRQFYPEAIEGDAGTFMQTIARFAQSLEVETIVPGHADLTSGAILGRYLGYLNDLMNSVRKATRDGQTLEETLSRVTGKPYVPTGDSPIAQLLTGIHRFNVEQVYAELNQR